MADVGDVETIGQRIKRERLARGWTQRQLAAAVEVGVPHISKIEAGRENPSDELLARLARVFDIEIDELLLVARRLPEALAETLAAEPEQAIAYLRKLQRQAPRRSRRKA